MRNPYGPKSDVCICIEKGPVEICWVPTINMKKKRRKGSVAVYKDIP